MFSSAIVDVAIGLVLVYLLLSLIASSIREGLEGWLKTRSTHLERGIRELLHDPSGTTLASDFYNHPLIYSLFRGEYDPTKIKQSKDRTGRTKFGSMPTRSDLPSYIPSRNFALALMDIVARGPASGDPSSADDTSPVLDLSTLRSRVAELQNAPVQRALLTAIDTANGNLQQAQKNIEQWFDSGMDRVSGWYKRNTQAILFVIGSVITIALNVNTFVIADFLYTHQAEREAAVAVATQVNNSEMARRARGDTTRAAAPTTQPPAVMPQSADTAPSGQVISDTAPGAQPTDTTARGDTARGVTLPVQRTDTARRDTTATTAGDSALSNPVRTLSALNLPIGWTPNPYHAPKNKRFLDWLYFFTILIFGLAATAFAVSLGAPFWFDMLNKFMIVRSTVKPHEKSPEEASDDRQRPRSTPGSGAGTPDPTVNQAGAVQQSVQQQPVQQQPVQQQPASQQPAQQQPSQQQPTQQQPVQQQQPAPGQGAAQPVATGNPNDPGPDYQPQEWAEGEPQKGQL